MSLKNYLVLFAVGTLLSWGAWVIVLTQMSPDVNRAMTVTAFAVSFGFAVAGTFAIAGFGVRAMFGNDPVLFRVLRTSVRQGVVVAVLLEGLLVLQAMRWFAWWNVAPLVIFFILLEGFFLSQEALRERQTR
ncbi:MAG: hypothetical protein Q8O51_03035 [bacterium]|nr:hypothetical protein [bacterium]